MLPRSRRVALRGRLAQGFSRSLHVATIDGIRTFNPTTDFADENGWEANQIPGTYAGVKIPGRRLVQCERLLRFIFGDLSGAGDERGLIRADQ